MDATPNPGWASTRRGRKELLALAVFCLLNLVIPLCCTELFPFSRAPMFADAPRQYCTYFVYGPDGEPLPPRDFGLQRNYWGNPIGVGVGFRPPPTVDRFGEVADAGVVTETVARHLARCEGLDYVDVVQEVTGPVDDRHVGVVAQRRWRVAKAGAAKGAGQ